MSATPTAGAPITPQSIPTPISQEMQESYLTYAMSVIMARALPDVRDGLKPSQRRILVAMNDLNLHPRAKHRKCAKICGDTSGNYHPHGEGVIYPTLVRMGQEWSMRHLLVDPQGNFGSIDGDPPAAMRYTEARLMTPAELMLEDLDKETVDFEDNYDGTRKEPVVLPGKFPNLLVNGSEGIAVGMATRLLPHNLGEICDAVVACIDNPNITIDELMKIVPGPDFPTGGVICGTAGIKEAYETGRGSIKVRGVLHTEELKNGRIQIVVDEIPYGVLLPTIKERVNEAVESGLIKGIEDLRDESGREQLVRLVIPLKKDANVQVTINQLWQYTPLESHLHAINVVLVNRVPRTLGLKQLIEHFVRHRVEVIRRRTQFLLRKARQRAHVLEGLILAVADIDEIIRLIRESPNADVARQRLMEKNLRLSEAATVRALLPAVFVAKATAADQRLTHTQADAILAMQLRRLTGLEIEQLAAEYTKLVEEIADYELILSDERRVLDIICEDMRELKEKLGEQRRTQIGGDVGTLELDELIAQEDVVVTISHEGYIKRVPIDTYRSQGRGGKGIRGTEARDGDFIEHLRVASTHDYLLFFTNRGRVYWLRVYDIPSMQRTSRGRALANVLTLQPNERHVAVLSVSQFEEQYAFFATEKGIVKKTPLRAFSNPRPSGIIAMSLDLDDSLIKVSLSNGAQQIVLGTRNGMACRFNEDEVRPMGRSARGVRGIALTGDDRVIDMVVIEPGMSLLTVCENGYGKRTDIEEYRLTHRGSKGVINIRTTERNGPVIAMRAVTDENDLMLITAKGTLLRMPMSDLREIGRATQGVRLIRVDEDDRVVAIARVVSEKEENAINGLSPAGEGADKSADILTQTPAANAAAAGNGEVREPDDVEPEAPAESDEAGENGDSEPQA
ncbi:MAG: DNA gyrase subunit A [Phycisphaerae bacterium]|mgnify:CR=1 FL=1|jgi:DNA gyrase subunit A|nr:DNA gyrase subunit A [Phycisphaerae bacterium]HOO15725.1 DNA gyrase subunit A [Phycisphaerae bacterium]HPC20840.1 DNA gyrase subunit A [Phycisphaerae bacterium]HRS27909.1 DNA gyrase subunit A [Phycisphaerae bacterium]HRT40613.1 DNA gyrase subunit A [Phycisphaerae bacterium]